MEKTPYGTVTCTANTHRGVVLIASAPPAGTISTVATEERYGSYSGTTIPIEEIYKPSMEYCSAIDEIKLQRIVANKKEICLRSLIPVKVPVSPDVQKEKLFRNKNQI